MQTELKLVMAELTLKVQTVSTKNSINGSCFIEAEKRH